MILAAAVCPHPPLLVPEVAPGTSDELADLRKACDDAVRTLLATGPERIVVIGAGELGGDRDETSGGTLAAYGVDIRVGGEARDLPLSLTIGAWLLDRVGWKGPRTYSTGRPETDGHIALLVMAGGSAMRSLQAPGFLDERAEAFDASIAAALGSGDAATLAALDVDLGAELLAVGVPALVTLGEMALGEMALGEMALGDTTKGTTISANLRVNVAPFGVGYFVADWVLS